MFAESPWRGIHRETSDTKEVYYKVSYISTAQIIFTNVCHQDVGESIYFSTLVISLFLYFFI